MFFCSKSYEKQIEEFKLNSNNDERQISSLTGHCRKLQNDLDALRELNERSNENISELKRKLAKTESESKLWKTKYEAEAVSKIEELEDENTKLRARIEESDVNRMEVESKLAAMKKKKIKALDELKEAKQETEFHIRKLDDGHRRVQDLTHTNQKLTSEIENLKLNLETSRRDIIGGQSEVNRLKMENEDLKHQVEVYREENAMNETKMMKHQEDLKYLDRKILELEQLKKRSDTEKDDLILAMDDLEFALDKAENKYCTVTKEAEKIRAECDLKIEEKEQEGRHTAIKLQALLDAEKCKSDNDMKNYNEAIRF